MKKEEKKEKGKEKFFLCEIIAHGSFLGHCPNGASKASQSWILDMRNPPDMDFT